MPWISFIKGKYPFGISGISMPLFSTFQLQKLTWKWILCMFSNGKKGFDFHCLLMKTASVTSLLPLSPPSRPRGIFWVLKVFWTHLHFQDRHVKHWFCWSKLLLLHSPAFPVKSWITSLKIPDSYQVRWTWTFPHSISKAVCAQNPLSTNLKSH